MCCIFHLIFFAHHFLREPDVCISFAGRSLSTLTFSCPRCFCVVVRGLIFSCGVLLPEGAIALRWNELLRCMRVPLHTQAVGRESESGGRASDVAPDTEGKQHGCDSKTPSRCAFSACQNKWLGPDGEGAHDLIRTFHFNCSPHIDSVLCLGGRCQPRTKQGNVWGEAKNCLFRLVPRVLPALRHRRRAGRGSSGASRR